MKKVVDLGGTITGEHGIGLAKVHFMSMQHSKAGLLHKRLKTRRPKRYS